MRIRRVEESDATQLVTLMSQIASESSFLLYEVDEVPSSAFLARRLSNTKHLEYIWVAEVGDKFVGYLALTLGSMKKNRGVGTLAIGVMTDYSNCGVGSSLMSTAIEKAREVKIYRLQLQVQTTNDRAVGLYKKFGFEIEGILRHVAKVNGCLVNKFMMAKLL